MTSPTAISFTAYQADDLAVSPRKIAVFVTEDGKMDTGTRKVNTLTRKTVARVAESAAFAKQKAGDVTAVAMPTGLAAEALLVVKLPRRPTSTEARKAGAGLAKHLGATGLLVIGGSTYRITEIAQGVAMRHYSYDDHKTAEKGATGDAVFMVADPQTATDAYAPIAAVTQGVFFTRDLTNAPANDLTTTSFADQLKALEGVGLTVEVLEEADLEKLGMGSLLCVGQGSDSPSKVVVMQWNGGGDEAPFAFVGKGVVFDTGGISIKPAGGMEDMTMDMGGAGVVSGVMKTLALRKAKANVVGIVGIVENMPSGNAVRPGDVVKSMKGDTIEVINTDAEGRLVLADVMWYAQERFKPVGMINLATLTGAILVALGHENAGVFSNSDDLSHAFLKAASTEGEGAWRLPLSPAYDALIKSRVADMKNVGGRLAGSITAAQFLQRFVQDDVPWIHLDIAGVASVKSETALAPAGATGWGVMALNRLIADGYEG